MTSFSELQLLITYYSPRQEVLPKNQIKGKRKPGVKLQLSKLREACGDQLAPFEGLWGYERELDNYPGTIFRFPLRTAKAKSFLKTNNKNLSSSEARQLMDGYFHEARVSLLFLRRIKSIDFSIHGHPDSGWSITRELQAGCEDWRTLSEPVTCSFVKNAGHGAQISGKDEWWVSIDDLHPPADRFPKISGRAMKNVECGFAALLSSTSDNDDKSYVPPELIRPSIFNTLLLPIASDLPVHVHATFLLSGDRQSISVDEDGSESHGAEWNRWLLQEALPNSYLTLLEDVGQKVGQDVFGFWPQVEPPKRSCAELLCTAFWDQLPTSSQRLFPKAQLTAGVPRRRKAHLFDISRAMFDFLEKTPSEVLAPLLLSLGVNLVHQIPAGIAEHLRPLSEDKSVTGPMLRQLLKSERAGACLLKEMAENPRIWGVLLDQLLPTDADLKDLDGCHLLPLADDSLAPLKFVDTEDVQSSCYYVASESGLKLFEFAAGSLITSKNGLKLGPILDSKKFNVAHLGLCHVKTLLGLRPTPVVSTPTLDTDKWLIEFWKFWNDNTSTSPEIDSWDVEVFQATLNGTKRYATPTEFQQLPAVIEPSIREHQELCDKIPGLYRFDPKFMPKSLITSRSSFYSPASFSGFIQALHTLAKDSGIGPFVQTHLGVSHLEVSYPSLIFNDVSC